MTVMNPGSIGNPDETPIVQISPELARALSVCEGAPDYGWCGGLQGYHRTGCPNGPGIGTFGNQPPSVGRGSR